MSVDSLKLEPKTSMISILLDKELVKELMATSTKDIKKNPVN
jgi:hypothetical protein